MRRITFMSKQILILLSIVFFAFTGLSLPYPILAPLFLSPDSILFNNTNLASEYRYILLGLTLAAYPLAQFVGSPILGGLSDRFGRKKLLILTILGTGLGYFLSALAIIYHSISLLFCSRLLTGFLEGNQGIAQASILDLGMDKYKGLGAISAFSALGYLMGPLIGGFLCDPSVCAWFNYSVPFFLGSAMALILALFTILFFKESYSNTAQQRKSLLAEFNLVQKIKSILQNPPLRHAFAYMVILSLSIDCYYEFYPPFLVEKWQMTPKLIGLYSVLLSLALSIGSFVIPAYLKKRGDPLRYRQPLLVIYILSLSLLFFVKTSFMINLHFFIVGLSYAAMNTIQSVMIAERADKDAQGEIMGLQWGLRMLGDGFLCIVGSLLLINAYYLPILLAVCFACCNVWVGRTKRVAKRQLMKGF